MMATGDIAWQRLNNQRISRTTFNRPDQVVAWLGALQAQEYPSVKWAIGLRCQGATDSGIEQAIASRTILRTWLLRGTLHIVAADDVGWMLALLAPRLIASSARRNQQLELDESTFVRAFEILTQTLQGGRRSTRHELMSAFERAGISPAGQRGYHILGRAAQKGLICFGPHLGKQQTFVLLDEWAPQGRRLEHDEALAELALRYFTGHGPATLRDFTWWSGLAAAEARSGLEMVKTDLHRETIDGQEYWFRQSQRTADSPSPTAHLLPGFDEYFLGYTDRRAILDPRYDKRLVSNNGSFRPLLVIDGQVVGVWKRELKKETVIVTSAPFNPLTHPETQALALAAKRLAAFLGVSVVLA